MKNPTIILVSIFHALVSCGPEVSIPEGHDYVLIDKQTNEPIINNDSIRFWYNYEGETYDLEDNSYDYIIKEIGEHGTFNCEELHNYRHVWRISFSYFSYTHEGLNEFFISYKNNTDTLRIVYDKKYPKLYNPKEKYINGNIVEIDTTCHPYVYVLEINNK